MTESPHIAARERRKRASLAATFVDDAATERLIEDVAAGKITPTPALRTRIGYYQLAKAAHDATTGEEQE